MRPTLPLLAAALAALAPGCRPSGGEPLDRPLAGGLERHELPRVRVRPVERREMTRRIETSTVVRSEREVAVLPRTGGVIVELRAEEGDAVEEGAVLCVLDRREAEAAVRDARIALSEAQNAVERARIATREAEAAADSARLAYEQAARDFERNAKAKLLSALELERLALTRDQAERTWASAKLAHERARSDEEAAAIALERAALALERAELTLSYSEVHAPFAGHITERFVTVGDSVTPSTPLFTLSDLDRLIAVVLRPQRELALFERPGPANGHEAGALLAGSAAGEGSAAIEITATAEALPGRTFRGEVLRLSPAIDPESGSFRVTVRIHPDTDGVQLRPGMLVRIEITTDRHPDALVVPKRAIVREGERRALYVVREGRARRVPVREGYADEEFVEVLAEHGAELLEGEAVIVVGNRELEDGDPVEVADREGALGEGRAASARVRGAGEASAAASPAESDAQTKAKRDAAPGAQPPAADEAQGGGEAGGGDAQASGAEGSGAPGPGGASATPDGR